MATQKMLIGMALSWRFTKLVRGLNIKLLLHSKFVLRLLPGCAGLLKIHKLDWWNVMRWISGGA